MGHGGTSWAGVAFGGVYTWVKQVGATMRATLNPLRSHRSYDYAAGIAENRSLRDKHREYANTAGFWQAFPAFIGASRVSAGAGNDVVTSSKPIYTGKFQGSDNQQFYIARQDDSTSFDTATFKLNATTIRGQRTIPAEGTFTLLGRDSRLVAINGKLSPTHTLLYSTSMVSFARTIGDRDVVLLHGDATNSFEAVFAAKNENTHFTVHAYGQDGKPASNVVKSDTKTKGEVRINWTAQKNKVSHVVLQAGKAEILVVLADTLSAYRTYNPPIAAKGTLEYHANTGELALVSGAYLIRNATISGHTLSLAGSSNVTSPIEVVTRPEVTSITFNGDKLDTHKTVYGSLRATAPGPCEKARDYKVPSLKSLTWRYADSLPEIKPNFDDSKWTIADKTSTPNDYFNSSVVNTEGRVLFAESYGFYANNVVWRGKFDSTGSETGIYFHSETGNNAAGALWLNEHFVGVLEPGSTYADAFQNFTFPAGALKKKDNVLTFLHDSSGYPEDGGLQVPIGYRKAAPGDENLVLQELKLPFGIIAYNFLGSNTTTVKQWKVQGNYKGDHAPDRVRTYLNEGGLHGEVQGWHLPAFDDEKWAKSSPMQGIQKAGVGFYRTTFKLDAPRDHDLPISLNFSEDEGTDYRALVYINGWQFGRRWSLYGPQTSFVLPPGILNPQGDNTLAISFWNLKDAPAKIGSLELKIDGVYTGKLDYYLNNPGWKELRG